MAKRRRGARSATAAEHRLNLIPILNLVLMLIPAILITTAFVQMAAINVSAPQLPSTTAEPEPQPPEERLRLTIVLTAQGVAVIGARAAGEGPAEIPRRPDGAYDWVRLTSQLEEVKDAHPEELRIFIRADPEIPYAHVVDAMDAARETADHRELFPDVVLSPGLI